MYHHAHCTHVGLGFTCQRCREIPTTGNDVILDRVLFPDSMT